MQVTDVDLMQVTTSSDVRYNIGKEMLPTWYSDSRITGNPQDHDEVPASPFYNRYVFMYFQVLAIMYWIDNGNSPERKIIIPEHGPR